MGERVVHMLLAYLDESCTRERYYMAAVVVPEDQARPLALALDHVVLAAAKAYGTSERAELHGHAIMQGKDDWAALSSMVRARIGVFDKALRAIGAHDVEVICCGVDTVRLQERYVRPDNPHRVVLQHLMEQVDLRAKRQQQAALLIADEVSDEDDHRQDLWTYQHEGTPGYLSSNLDAVVDTLHFAPSAASRLLQAADLAAYLHRRRETHTETDSRAKTASDRMWSHIRPRIVHRRCWGP